MGQEGEGEREKGEGGRERGVEGECDPAALELLLPRMGSCSCAAQDIACAQEPVMFNCSGCCPSYGLQICEVAPETFSLSMRSCPSSSQLIVSTNLSHVSSGNHCRSDPVQVQSTFECVGTAVYVDAETNNNVVLTTAPPVCTTSMHTCCRMRPMSALVGAGVGGFGRGLLQRSFETFDLAGAGALHSAPAAATGRNQHPPRNPPLHNSRQDPR